MAFVSLAQRVRYSKKSGGTVERHDGIMGRTRAVVQSVGVDVTQQASNCHEQTILGVNAENGLKRWVMRGEYVSDQIFYDVELSFEMVSLRFII